MGLRAKKRTTLTIPAEFLNRAEQIAKAEHVSVNTILIRAMERGLKQLRTPEMVERLLESQRRALEGLSEEELLWQQGIIMEPIGPDNPEPGEDGW